MSNKMTKLSNDLKELFSDEELAYFEAVAPTPKKYAPNGSDKTNATGSKSGTLSDTNEEVEELDEIKKPLANYIKKRKEELKNFDDEDSIRRYNKKGVTVGDQLGKDVKARSNKYIAKAKSKLGEEVEQIEENNPSLSPKQKNIARLAGDKEKIDAEDMSALRAGKHKMKENTMEENNQFPQYGRVAIRTRDAAAMNAAKDELSNKLKNKEFDLGLGALPKINNASSKSQGLIQRPSPAVNENEQITEARGRPPKEASLGANELHMNAKRAADNMTNITHKFANGDRVKMTKGMGVAFLNRHTAARTPDDKDALLNYAHQSPETFEHVARGGSVPKAEKVGIKLGSMKAK